VSLFGPNADGWADRAVLVIPGTFDFEVRAADGELLGLIERGGRGANYDPPHPRQPVTDRAVIRASAEAWPAPPAVKFPAGFVPSDPARATAGERARWGGTGTGTAGGASAAVAQVVYDPHEPCPDCTWCSANGCHRGEGSDCRWSEALGDYTCPCTGG
jgi:hypothetical protein